MEIRIYWRLLLAVVVGVAFGIVNEVVWTNYSEFVPTIPLIRFIGEATNHSAAYFVIGAILDWPMYVLIALPFAMILGRSISVVAHSHLACAAIGASLVFLRFYVIYPSSLATNPPRWQFVVALLGITLAIPIAFTLYRWLERKIRRVPPIEQN